MDPKKIRKSYMKALPQLNRAMQHVQSHLANLPPSDFLLETNFKPYDSVKKKLVRDGVRDPLELSDLVRGRVFFSEQFDFPDVINLLKKVLGPVIKKIDKKTSKSKEHGLEYHGIVHLDLDIDGIKFELQIMPIEFKPHKELLHKIYEKFRTPEEVAKLTDKQKKFLREVHNKAYKALEEQAKKNRSKR